MDVVSWIQDLRFKISTFVPPMAGEMGIVCDMCQLLGGAVPATVSWYSHNFWDAIPTYGYNQAFTIYYAPTALSNVHLFAWQAESCPSLLGSCIWRTSSYTSSTWLPFWKMCTWLGYHFAADIQAKELLVRCTLFNQFIKTSEQAQVKSAECRNLESRGLERTVCLFVSSSSVCWRRICFGTGQLLQ